MLFASRYSNFTCLDSSCLQASITVMTCLVRAGGSIAILLQANYSNISNQSVINISTYTPASPATLTTTIYWEL